MPVYYDVIGLVPSKVEPKDAVDLATTHEVLSIEYHPGKSNGKDTVAFKASIKVQDPQPTFRQLEKDVRLSINGKRVRGGQFAFYTTEAD